MIQEARQSVMKNLGDNACYMLCMDWIAESLLGERVDSVESYMRCLAKGWCDSQCYMLKPASLLSWRTGIPFIQVLTEDGSPSLPLTTVVKPNWEVLMRYERKMTSLTKSHFVVVSPSDSRIVLYDPYYNSDTVANGKPVSLRAFSQVS